MFTDDTCLDILERYVGEEKREAFVDYYYNAMDYKKEVLDNPHIYGPRDGNRMDANNIKYLMMSRMLTLTLDLEVLVNLLHDIEVETGHSMRYFAVDSRLLPVGPTNTGIYYAPTKLSDQNINDFLEVIAIGNDGSRTNVQDQKAMEERYNDLDYRITKYEIEYKDMFYNSMFYKAYIGWTPIDVEINEPGIPTISRPDDVGRTSLEIQGMPPIQGWGMTHHRLEYRTQYWNPNKTNPQDHPGDWEVVSPSKAEEYRNMSESDITEVADNSGIIDTTYRGLYAGVFFLKYYDGAFINGTITLEDGSPLSGARVTVYDDLELANAGWPGAPHGYTHTDENGHYSIVAPYGNTTVRVSNGGQDPSGQIRTYELFMQMEKRVLNDTVIEISDNQAMRVDEDTDGDGIWDYNIKHNVVVNLSKLEGRAYWDLDDNNIFEEEHDEVMVGHIGLMNSTYGNNYTAVIDEMGNYSIPGVVPDDYELGIMSDSEDEDYFTAEFRPVDENNQANHDIHFPPAMLNGTVVNEDNETLPGVKLILSNRTGSVSYETETDEDGYYILDRLLPGNYTLKVDDVRYMSSVIRLDLDEGIHNTTNITLTTTVRVTGDAVLADGSPASNAILVFRNLDDDSLSVQVQVSADGTMDGHVPPGQYSINGKVIKDHATYVFMRTASLEEAETPMDVDFVRAYRINGTIYKDMNDNGEYDPLYGTTTGATTDPGSGSGSGPGGEVIPGPTPGPAVFSESKDNIMVEFEDANGNISMLSNDDGYYEVYLTTGEYIVYSHTQNPDQNLTGLAILKVDKDQEVDIRIDHGTWMEGSVFHDQNQNGILDEGEELDGAKMTFLDLEGNTLVRSTNETGYFDHLLPSVEYNLTVWYDGYIHFAEDIEVQGETLHKNIILKPENITINGMVGFDEDRNGIIDPDEGLAVSIRLIPEGGPFAEENQVVDIETNETGLFDIDIFPQNYTVTIDETITPEDGTGARFKFDDNLNLSIGHGTEVLEITLDRYFKVYGDIFYDENGNDILNSGERRNPVIEFYTPDGDRIDAEITPDGYEVYLLEGTYYYYTHQSDAKSVAYHTAALGVLTVKEETEMVIQLLEATRVNGVLYFDENENGDVDTGEQERDVEVLLTRLEGEIAKGTIMTTSNDIGEYSIYVPWGYNYTTTVDMVDDRDLHNVEYTVKFAYTTLIVSEDGRKNTMEDLPVDEFYLVNGNVTYQAPDAPVDLAGAQVLYDEFKTVTALNGSYELFVRPGEYAVEVLLPGFELPESVFGNRTIDYTGTLQDFVLDPVNVTVEGRVYVDHNGDGAMDPRTESVKATLEFISTDIWAINASTVTDTRGTFRLDLEPGAYHVWISAEEGLHHYVTFENFSLNASGDVLVLEFELKEGVTLQGEVYYDDTDGTRHTPADTNITVLDTMTGAEKIFPVTSRQFAYHLPAGDYHLTAKVTNNEHDQEMEYILDTDVNLTERTKLDMVFEKVKLYYLDIVWDESERVTLPQNSSVTYSISVTNVGNEPATFDIDGTAPGGWKSKTSVDEVSLGIGKSTDFTVLINVSDEARAGKNTINIRSKYVLNDDFANSTPMYVDVIQVYNISIEASDNDPSLEELEGYYRYYVNVVNNGNGRDKVNITTLSSFPSWDITFSEPNPLLSDGQTKEIEIRLAPEDVRNMTGREMTLQLQATSQTGLTADYELIVTFPDLSGSLQVNGPGVKSKKDDEGPRRMPGFEFVFVVAAIAVAVIYRRGNLKGGVDR